jgi:hypothetical protein
MQINLYSKAVKNGILYLGWFLFFLCLWYKGCSSSQPQTASVTVPAISNTLPADRIVKHERIEVTKWYKDRTNEKKLSKDILEMYDRLQAYQEEIDNMHSEYQNSDFTKQAELYRLATELKKFESNFEDEYLKLTINGIIAGNQVKEITPTYTIKERKIEVPIQQVKFRFLGGVGLGNTMAFEKPFFNANVGFQNAKGNILRIGYDSEKRIFVGYDFSIFKITR